MATISRQRVPLSNNIHQAVALALRRFEAALARLAAEIDDQLTTINTAVDAAEADITAIEAQLIPASDTAAGFIEIAVQSEMETATDTTRAVVPGRMRFHPGVAKCWSVVNVTGGTHALAASLNITSITDGSTGQHTVTIATDFSSANWACMVSAQGSDGIVANTRVASPSAKAVGSVVISTYDLSATPALADAVSVSMVGFGDHA